MVLAGAYRILVVDDQDAIRKRLCSNLTDKVKFLVCGEARNGAEAVDKSTSLQPDAVILDVSMPVLNGLEAARMIRKACPNTAILILSVHKSKQLVEEARRIGVHGYINKSDAGRDLCKALDAILPGGRTFFPVDGDL